MAILTAAQESPPVDQLIAEALLSDVKEIRTDIKSVMTRQGDMAVVQERQTQILDRQQKSVEEHIKRTELLEQTVKPLTDKEARRAGVTRFGSAIAGLLVAGAAAVEIFFHLFHLAK